MAPLWHSHERYLRAESRKQSRTHMAEAMGGRMAPKSMYIPMYCKHNQGSKDFDLPKSHAYIRTYPYLVKYLLCDTSYYA